MPIPSDAPAGVAALLRRCLDPEPAQRPEFAAVLDEVQRLMLAHRASARAASLPLTGPAELPVVQRRPASVEVSRAQSPALQRRTPSPPAPAKQAAQQAAPDREQLRERQRQLVHEQEEWQRRHQRLDAPAAPVPLAVAAPARAPCLPSPFMAAPAPAAAPAHAPTLLLPFGDADAQQL